ncbi:MULTISPECIES: hypothetical protein [unclassified Nitrobacter]|uniref:hypothetical protein n=1 Tax=unclassified Nitrobacter TaxID=2620411 RepID=UPI0009282740|nr:MULTISPECIES: hypothetical protein [unclassified Nitrobacter]MBN9149158.1 hypothetical protein [Nitrobacter sp.]OJV00599.1 MAG: hypothetical protein BGO16_11020 [Nitrobacter sp. 62-23]
MSKDNGDKILTVEGCLLKARNLDVYTFRAEDADFCVVLNYGKIRITLARGFLYRYAFSTLKEGDPMAVDWAEALPMPLSDDVSVKIMVDAIYFNLSSGDKYKIRRSAFRAWLDEEDGWEFPGLEQI